MNSKKKFSVKVLVIALALCMAVTYLVYAQAGTDSDPVISLSYLKSVFKPEVKDELTFKVVTVSAGQAVVCDEGTELILRMGTANVIATAKGGLADVTAGYDVSDGSKINGNHHLIVPLGDGRGAKAVTECIFMIKGTYTIQ